MLQELRVGMISATHGLKGELKVIPTTDDPKRFLELKKLRLRKKARGLRREDETEQEFSVESVRFQKELVLLKLSGIDRIEDAENLRGSELWIDRADAVALADGEYFLGDYIGLRVLTEDGEELGKIRSILETGANYVFSVEREGGKELLIPNSENCVLEKKPEEGYLRIHLLEGLLDL